MGKNKKFAVVITEEKNGRNETSTIYADSVTDAMNYIALIKNKKAKVRITDANENLIHSESLGSKRENKNDDKKDKDKRDKDKDKKDKKDKEHDEPRYHHGNGYWSHEEPRDDDDDDYMYA